MTWLMTIPLALDTLNYMADQLNQRAQQIVEKEVEVLIGEKAFPLVRISQQVYQRGSLPLLKFCTFIMWDCCFCQLNHKINLT